MNPQIVELLKDLHHYKLNGFSTGKEKKAIKGNIYSFPNGKIIGFTEGLSSLTPTVFGIVKEGHMIFCEVPRPDYRELPRIYMLEQKESTSVYEGRVMTLHGLEALSFNDSLYEIIDACGLKSDGMEQGAYELLADIDLNKFEAWTSSELMQSADWESRGSYCEITMQREV